MRLRLRLCCVDALALKGCERLHLAFGLVVNRRLHGVDWLRRRGSGLRRRRGIGGLVGGRHLALVGRRDGLARLDGVGKVHVLELVEDRAALAAGALVGQQHLRIIEPVLDHLLADPIVQERAVKGVGGRVDLQPVDALCQPLERRRREVNRVVRGGRWAWEVEAVPLGVELATDRARRRRAGVGGAEHLGAEVRPRQPGGVKLDLVVVDAAVGGDELGAGRHEETVDGVGRLAEEDGAARERGVLDVDLAAVEASTDLDRVPECHGVRPRLLHGRGVDLGQFAHVEGVEHAPLVHDLVPVLAEGRLELILGDVELFGLEHGRLGRHRVEVLVDELMLVDGLGFDAPLRQDSDALLSELGLDDPTHAPGVHRVRQDEDERALRRGLLRRLCLALHAKHLLVVCRAVLGEGAEAAHPRGALVLFVGGDDDLLHEHVRLEVDDRAVRRDGAVLALLGAQQEEVRVVGPRDEEEVRAAAPRLLGQVGLHDHVVAALVARRRAREDAGHGEHQV